MKKLLMLFAVVAFVGTAATAQCTKGKSVSSKATCTKSKAAAAKTVNAELPACPHAAAAKLASMDENIESRTCAKSGKTAYYKKNTCSTSGKTYFKEVQFDGESQTFVNVAPPAKPVKAMNVSELDAKKGCTKSKAACTKSKAACSKSKTASAKTVSAKTVSLEKKKACTKGTAGKSCCASKKASTVKAAEGKATLVKQVNEK